MVEMRLKVFQFLKFEYGCNQQRINHTILTEIEIYSKFITNVFLHLWLPQNTRKWGIFVTSSDMIEMQVWNFYSTFHKKMQV